MADLCLDNPAFKLFIKDLCGCEKVSESWQIYFGNDTDKHKLNQFQIQGTVTRVTGFNNEIIIVDDTTGKAKVTRSSKVPGEFSWVKTGAFCSIVGMLIDSGKLPHIDVIKMAQVENPLQREMWPLEVTDLKNYLSYKAVPTLSCT